ncbi:hypothetical protein ACFWB6_38065 [Streptomyces mirabilis]|uniref:hypothetical protein n=1 Tax=Streptomyces mirabilis TaxID=68239 RepID=UPI0036CE321D
MATAADHQGADAKWLLTEKISWIQVNAFPHHAFRWEGIGGAQPQNVREPSG